MWFLRQSTASQEIPLGPFVDSTDGNTAETGLTIANTDIKLFKTGATSEVNKNSGGATHVASGRYYAVLDATDTDTIGPLRVSVHVAGALAVWLDCCVLDEAVYDVVFGTTAPATTGNLGGSTVGTTTNLTNDPSGVTTLLTRLGTPSNLGGGATVAANLADIEAQTDDIGAAGAGLTSVPWNAAWDAEVQSEVQDAIEANRLDELLAADSDIDGAAPPTVGSVFHELMSKTAGSFTFDQTTDSLEALRDRGDAAWVTATGFSTLSSADVSAAVWNAATASYGTAGSYGALVETALPNAAPGASGGLFRVGTNSAAVTITASTGPALKLVGGADSHGLHCEGTGIDGHGILATGGTGGGGAGLYLARGSSSGDDLILANNDAASLGTVVWAAAARTLTTLDEDSTALDLDATIRAALATELARIDVAVSTRMATYTQPTGFLAATFPASVAAVGSAMTLTPGERDAVAAALLDLANGVETSVTLRQALRAIAAGLAGNVTGGGASYKALANAGTTRLGVVDDGAGNRTVTPSL